MAVDQGSGLSVRGVKAQLIYQEDKGRGDPKEKNLVCFALKETPKGGD